MRRFVFLAACAVASFAAVTAKADSLMLASPGYYNGSGGINNGFTITNTAAGTGSIELGLRAENRFPTASNPNVIFPTGNVYQVAGGLYDATHANWNYDFSINLASSGYTLGGIVATLTVADGTDSAANTTIALNNTLFGDDSGYHLDSSNNVIITHSSLSPTVVGFANNLGDQNSENPMYAQFALNSVDANYFLTHQFDTYDFTLTIKTTAGAQLATDNIVVSATATPLPSSLWQCAALLGGMGLFTAFKRRTAVPAT